MNNESGESKIVWVLFVVIVLLIGTIVYGYVYYNDKLVNQTTTSTVAVVEETPEATVTPIATSTVSADETADWQTYNIDFYDGFSIKLPANWMLLADNNDHQFGVRKIDWIDSEGDYWININQISNSDPYSLLETNSQDYGLELYNTKVGNYFARAVNMPSTSQSPAQNRYVIEANETYYGIEVSYINQSDNIGKQIIDTLQFN